MVVKIDDKKWESAMDLANSENYQTTLDHLESWTETLATFGPESLPKVYAEMVEFLKITPKDLAENKATNPTEVLESLDILSAQCGNARIRTPHKRRIKAFILGILSMGLVSCAHSFSFCETDHSCPEEGHGPCFICDQ